MARKLPHLQLHVAEWVQDTRILSLEARALWLDIICLMHNNDRRGYLQSTNGSPLSPEQIASFAGCSAAVVTRVLRELLDSGVASCTDDGVLYCRRMVRDERKRVLCAQAGRLGGGNPALQRHQSNGTYKGQPKGGVKGGAKGASVFFEENLFHEEVEEKNGEVKKIGGCGGEEGKEGATFIGHAKGQQTYKGQPKGGDDFDTFWSAYPRKTAKQDAYKSWLKLNPDERLLAAILAAVERQKQWEQWRKGIVPHPATWLNQRRWEDEMPPPSLNGHGAVDDQTIDSLREQAAKRKAGAS